MRRFFSRTALLWLVWTVATLAAGSAVAAWMFVGGDRRALLPNDTTGVHHQFEVSCDTCHRAKAFSTEKKTLNALNKTCRGCHDDELKASNDSHPRKKFRNPRMADYWEKIDARYCTSCHIEHKPEITRVGAVTLAMDYCVACHSEGEQDVRKNRPSHADLSFDSCATAGCHNFHDNRALYEDFLVKHAGEPWLKEPSVHAASARARASRAERLDGDALAEAMAKWLTRDQAIAPAFALEDPAAIDHWAASGHAEAGVNCAGCHAPKAPDDADLAALEAHWIEKPEPEACASCHRDEAKTFREGRHGARWHPKVAKPRKLKKGLKALGLADVEKSLPDAMRAWLEDPAPPKRMSVAEARIPMKAEAHGREATCVSCHTAHEVNLVQAAVSACASCHADDHTAAYFESPHYDLFKAEAAGEAAKGSGVSCATCHMPTLADGGDVLTTHNQNEFLRPNEKMIRAVCLDCHGLAFSIDSLADPDLVTRNFQGRPAVHIESIDWAVRRVKPDDAGANQ